MKKKLSYRGGFFSGMNFAARLTETAFLASLLDYKERKGYIEDGYEGWDQFCGEELGVSCDMIDKRLKALHNFGPEIAAIMFRAKMNWKDIRAIDHCLSEDQKTQLKKGVIEIDGRKIQVKEEMAPEVLSAFDLIIERAANAKKAEDLAERKLAGIEREHKKEVKAMSEENERLKAMLPQDDEDREWAERFLEEIAKRGHEWDVALRQFAMRKKLYSDPVLQAKAVGAMEEMRKLFDGFERDFDAFLAEGME